MARIVICSIIQHRNNCIFNKYL